jgi:pSer/pThr/pTyr-binding forkhead associated (FHA) protein
VAFVLTITQGEGSGETFSFDEGEARLGRTADNDVVVRDGSASRSHARVYEENGEIFVEDLKSANGTIVNRSLLRAPRVLANGDTITIGDVELRIDIEETAKAAPDSTMDERVDLDATIPPKRKPQPPMRSRDNKVKRTLEPAPDESLHEMEPVPNNATQEFAVGVPKVVAKQVGASVRSRGSSPGSKSAFLAKVPSRVTAPVRRSAPAEDDEGALAVSAAERLRMRRKLSTSAAGRFQVLWADFSKPARIVFSVIGLMLAVVAGGVLIWGVIPETKILKVEPLVLEPNTEPETQTFGLGGVDFERPDLKGFTFTYRSAAKIVGVLHYSAKDIQKEEVALELNGVQLGYITPDTLESDSRELELVLPTPQIKNGEPNEFVFDNVLNPPGKETWRVWNIWVEMIPIPDMSAEGATKQAQDDIRRAQKLELNKNLGAGSLFGAWEKYRDAWLLLESTPERPTALLESARSKMKELRPELDRLCANLLIEYQQEMSQKNPNYTRARAILKNVTQHFPSNKHHCFSASRGLLKDLDE